MIILEPSNENFGHIETLCAEKWLYLIFNDHYYSQRERRMMSIWMHASMDANPISDLFWLKKLHLVLNWLIGKVYAP